MIERSHYIKFNWLSNDPRLLSKAEELNKLLLDSFDRRPRRHFTVAFNAILTSVEVQGGFNGWWIRIPTDNNLYSGKTQRNATYTSEVKDCLLWMIKSGYLVKVDSLRAPSHRQTGTLFLPFAYQVTPKLSEESLAHPSTIYRNPLAGYIDVRQKFGKVKRSVGINEREQTRYASLIKNTNKLLAEYDELMKSFEIKIGTKPVNTALLSMTRIFSRGTLELGGRYYFPLQNIRSEARKYFSFNGEPVVEIDFAAIHPTMLYQSRGLELDEDPYTIEGWKRTKVKVAFNIMLNRDGGPKATSAAKAISNNLGISLKEAKALELSILMKHKPIAAFFNTDKGLELQRLDSKIITHILQYFVRTLKRPIVTVHDSALVSIRDVESLRLAMEAAYEEVLSDKVRGTQRFIRAIKVESLEFNDELNDHIERSLDGTLNNYESGYMERILEGVKTLKCPEELYSTKYFEDPL